MKTPTLDQLEQALDRARREPPPMRSHGEILHSTSGGYGPWAWLTHDEKQDWRDWAAEFHHAIAEESRAWHLENDRFEPFHLWMGRWYARCVRRLLGSWIHERGPGL